MPLSSLLYQRISLVFRNHTLLRYSSMPVTQVTSVKPFKKKRRKKKSDQWVELIQEVATGFSTAEKANIIKKLASHDILRQLILNRSSLHKHESAVISKLRVSGESFNIKLPPTLLHQHPVFVPRTRDPRVFDATSIFIDNGQWPVTHPTWPTPKVLPSYEKPEPATQSDSASESCVEVSEDPYEEVLAGSGELSASSTICFQPTILTTDIDADVLCSTVMPSVDKEFAEDSDASDIHLHPSQSPSGPSSKNVPGYHSKIKPKFPLKKLSSSSRRTSYLRPEEQEKLAKHKTEEMEKIAKDINLSYALRSYIDVCIQAKMTNRAYATLVFYSDRSNRSKGHTIRDVRSFNTVLTALAEKGNLNHLMELVSLMRRERIRLNVHSYMALLLCLSYASGPSIDSIKSVLDDMQKNQIDVHNIFRNCIFTKDHRERVLSIIRLAYPDYSPPALDIPEWYTCHILLPLNETVPRYYTPVGNILDLDSLLNLSKQQWERELSGYIKVQSVEKQSSRSQQSTIAKEKFAKWEAAAEKSVTAAFNRKLRKLHQDVRSQDRSINLLPFLSALDPKVYVNVILLEVLLLSELPDTFSPPLFTLQSMIGLKVMSRYQVQKKLSQDVVKKLKFLYEKYSQYYLNPELTSKYTPRQYWHRLLCLFPEGPSVDVEDRMWPFHVLIGVGQFLYDIILNDIKINSNILKPNTKSERLIFAFYTVYRHQGSHLREEVKCHPIVHQLRKLAGRDSLTFETSLVPVLSPPLPWSSVRTGGYLMSSARFIRLPQLAAAHRFQLDRTPPQQLYPILDSLNQLSECPWIINQPMLDLIIEVFNSGGDMSLDVPPPPSNEPLPSVHLSLSKSERAKALRQRMKVKQHRAEMYSLWCDTLYKLSIANHFRDDIFWFPHNLDFRGRTYPCPPHFNHLGSDLTRSILLFAKGEPLGETGLDWLKKHVVNLTGLKKRDSVEERLRFANEMLPEIIDSAEKPLTGNRWWMKSDEPWQTLACCKEIVKVLQSPDPASYICHFPVHQDGSCNGLQHYAALGRDQHGAEQVNLAPSDVPQDVYSGVAALVELERAKDAEQGVEIAQLLKGFIRRKVIKQTVMTTVYGVTAYGARLQILRQLKDIPDFPQEKVWSASSYLTKKTFFSLRQMFTATKEIQDWFTESARLISQVRGQPVEWVTPLGLPIIQPYHRPLPHSKIIPDGPLSKRPLAMTDMFERPNVMKQKNAFPPNFIHSLDSTHMMLTSLHCQRAGITFVSVHDCFWTHPSTVTVMNEICREQFVALHQEPILENLSRYLVHKFSYSPQELKHDNTNIDEAKKHLNAVLTQVPEKGKFNLDQVLHSTYFFS